MLIPAALLVNGHSIRLHPGEGDITYYHLGFSGHDVVLAEGAACEAWHDDAGDIAFDTPPPPGVGSGPTCAPKCGYGPQSIAIWQALHDRAGIAPPPLAADPGLHLLADGRPVLPDFRHANRYRFTLPQRPLDLRLLSRSAVPAQSGLGPDIRRLGVGVQSIAFAQHGLLHTIAEDDPALGDGFHPADPASALRWTTGAAHLASSHLRLARGPLRMEVIAIGLAGYPPE